MSSTYLILLASLLSVSILAFPQLKATTSDPTDNQGNEHRLKVFGYSPYFGLANYGVGIGLDLNLDVAIGYTFPLYGDDVYTYIEPTIYVLVGGD